MTEADTEHRSKEEVLSAIAEAAVELAQYASYANIVGAVGHNQMPIRKWSDEIFRLNHAYQEMLEAEEPARRAEPHWLVLKERDLLRQAIVRYGDRRRMGTVEPQELQQAIDDAFEAVDVPAAPSLIARAMAEIGYFDDARVGAGEKPVEQKPSVIGDGPWKWWAGTSDEWFTEGPFESREEAVIEATVQRLGEFKDSDGLWKLRFCLVEARQNPLRLADHLDVERMLEAAEDSLESSERVGELDDGPFFGCTPEQEKDLASRVASACDAWQQANSLRFDVKTFSHTRGEELVVVPRPDPDLSHE